MELELVVSHTRKMSLKSPNKMGITNTVIQATDFWHLSRIAVYKGIVLKRTCRL